MKSRCTRYSLLLAVCLVSVSGSLPAQEKSVRPGINDTFRDPDPKQFTERFEIESREVFAKREEILKAIQLKPTDVVADIGAGTGLFTRLFAAHLGAEGRVIAVDIARRFLDHIEVTCRERNLRNVETLLCTDDSTQLPPNSIDVAFICDTYHHFEYPLKTMTSLRKALKPGGRVIVVDFRRVEGESTEWTMNHVRAGQEVFEADLQYGQRLKRCGGLANHQSFSETAAGFPSTRRASSLAESAPISHALRSPVPPSFPPALRSLSCTSQPNVFSPLPASCCSVSSSLPVPSLLMISGRPAPPKP